VCVCVCVCVCACVRVCVCACVCVCVCVRGAKVHGMCECNGENCMLGVIPMVHIFMRDQLCVLQYIP